MVLEKLYSKSLCEKHATSIIRCINKDVNILSHTKTYKTADESERTMEVNITVDKKNGSESILQKCIQKY